MFISFLCFIHTAICWMQFGLNTLYMCGKTETLSTDSFSS